MIASRAHTSPWLSYGADHYCLPDVNGTGADVLVRGPGFYAARWHGLGWLRAQAVDCWQDVFRSTVGDVVETPCVRYQDGRLTPELHRFYEQPLGLEWEIVWPDRRSVPSCGYVDFDIATPPGCQWHYQPPLRPEERETHERPPHVVGSFACYSPRSGRYLRPDGSEIVNFETGKLTHLYRSFVRTGNYNGNFLYTTPASNGNASDVSLYANRSSGTFGATLGIWGTGGLILRDTSEIAVGASKGWVSGSLDSALGVSSGTYYWLGQNHGTGNLTWYYDSTSPVLQPGYQASTYSAGTLSSFSGTPPNNYNSGTASIYATYTVAASGFPYQLLLGNVRHARTF